MTTIKDIKARLEAATPGPWKRHHNKRYYVYLGEDFVDTEQAHEANAQLCANSSTFPTKKRYKSYCS